MLYSTYVCIYIYVDSNFSQMTSSALTIVNNVTSVTTVNTVTTVTTATTVHTVPTITTVAIMQTVIYHIYKQ